MLKVPWTAKISNEVSLQQANEERSLIKDIRNRQSHFLGHIQKEQIEHSDNRATFLGRETGGDNRTSFWIWQIGWGRGQLQK
jgi:hypothetical protein